MRRFALIVWALATATLVTIATAMRTAQTQAWGPWQHLSGVADLAFRSDGLMVAMANARLYLISPSTGAVTPFAATPDGFLGGGDPAAEYYFVVTPAQSVDGTDCAFTADDVFILDLTSPPAVVRVDASGRAQRFATFPTVETLGGIAVDTIGSFGHRLLVTGTRDNKTSVFGVDCVGSVSTLTSTAPPVEGGIEVAPRTFGQFGGMLIAPDENSGQIFAIDASGNASLLAVPNLPTGGDTGVESIGFVPPGFMASGGQAYLADRGTPDNPYPGTDTILRLSAATLAASGVQDGDLLVSTEGGGSTVGIRCTDACSVFSVAQGTPGGHIEGHIVFSAP